MEEKKKGVLRFFKLSTGRHKRETAPGTPAQAVKGRKGRKKWVKPLVILLIIGAAAAAAMTFRGMKAKAATARGTVPQYGIGGAQGHFLRAVFLRNP
ncbi:MAG: hypothetical protein ACLTBV_25110 [Enterocloster bolteae]